MRGLSTSPAAVPAGRERRRLLRALALCGAASSLTIPCALVAGKADQRHRVVSIGGGLTEIIYALGAGDALAGVDTTSLHPASAARLPSVGYARTLSSEGILALAPTLVVATEDAGPPAVLRQLMSAGLQVRVLRADHRFEGVLDRVSRLGELLDRKTEAARLGERLSGDWQRARATVAARKAPPPRVMFVFSHSPGQVLVGGRGSSADAMLAYAGARNAIQGFDGYKPLTPEAVIAAQPDAVLFTEQGLRAVGGMDGALKLPGLGQTPAGQQRRVLALEAMFLLGFGPRMPEAVAALDAALSKTMLG